MSDSEEVFVVRHQRVGVRLPEKAADLWGTSGEVQGTLGNSGKRPENWTALKLHSERSSGEVAGELSGKGGGG